MLTALPYLDKTFFMTNTNMNLKSTDVLAKLARLAYPEYKGRKIRVRVQKSYQMMDYWSEGTRTYAKAINLTSFLAQVEVHGLSGARFSSPNEFVHNPMNGGAHASFEIPAGIAIIEHSFFCGKDCGLTIVVGPQTALPTPAEQKAIES